MTTKTPAEIANSIFSDSIFVRQDVPNLSPAQSEWVNARLIEAAEKAREGMTSTPPFPREVWGVQVGTWPPEKMQTKEQAYWYADQPMTGIRGGKPYPVHVVKGTEYTVDWQIVETWEDGFQK